jgi:hypothetical protein
VDCPKVHREYDPSAKDIQGDVNYQSFARIVQSHHAQIQSDRDGSDIPPQDSPNEPDLPIEDFPVEPAIFLECKIGPEPPSIAAGPVKHAQDSQRARSQDERPGP